MVQTEKAIGQLQKEIRKLKEGIVSIEDLITEKEREVDTLQRALTDMQLKIINNAERNEKI